MNLMINNDLAQFLEDNEIGTVGTDIWGELPLNKKNAIGVVPSPSPDPNKAFSTATQVFDIWGRFSNATKAKQKMQAIYSLLHGKANYVLGDFHVYLSSAQGLVEDLDRDEENQHIYKLTIVFSYREN